MAKPTLTSLIGAFLLFAPSGSLVAQTPARTVVVHGRVEDAVTHSPVPDALVLAADSTVVASTDSTGDFRIRLHGGPPYTVVVARLGYLDERFDLGPDAPSHPSVLRVEPAPLPVEGVTVRDEAPLQRLTKELHGRRNSAASAVFAFDRRDLERFALDGTVADFLQRRVPLMRPCRSDSNEECVPSRYRSVAHPNPERRVLICVDARRSAGALMEMETLPVESLALVEVYGGMRPWRINVYTTDWVLWSVRTGHIWVLPLVMGCG